MHQNHTQQKCTLFSYLHYKYEQIKFKTFWVIHDQSVKFFFFYTYSTRMHIDATFTLAMDKIVIIFHIKLIVRIGDMFQEMHTKKPS